MANDNERGLYAPDGSYRVTLAGSTLGTPDDLPWDGEEGEVPATLFSLLKAIATNTAT